ncbi:DUF551 domain-containing protein [Citrobacter freundii]|uniref:DUF551 domain-containing protein n=1 Tax=Citrobacter freundii TaxID=546 RepID=UPI0039C96EBA
MTTNNHPANGPVSLDRLHQISEILSKASAQSDGGNLGYAMADAVKVIDGVIAAFGAEPVAYLYSASFERGHVEGELTDAPGCDMPVYSAPPALVSVPDEIEPDDGNAFDYVDGWNACRAAMLQVSQPVSNRDELLELIEGMEVSVDVSTCDADAGHRYFGTVTEISELETAKNGFILLVQDAKPNFKQTGNSPATPDCWIPVSERMPDDDDFVYIWPRPDFGIELHVGQYCECHPKGDGWYAQVYEQNYGIEWHPIIVTHWLPLPAAPKGEHRDA